MLLRDFRAMEFAQTNARGLTAMLECDVVAASVSRDYDHCCRRPQALPLASPRRRCSDLAVSLRVHFRLISKSVKHCLGRSSVSRRFAEAGNCRSLICRPAGTMAEHSEHAINLEGLLNMKRVFEASRRSPRTSPSLHLQTPSLPTRQPDHCLPFVLCYSSSPTGGR